MTKEQVELLKLGIMPIDDRVILIVESALDWVSDHTTLDFDKNDDEDLKNLLPCVRLFVLKFFDVQMLCAGVTSESIEGLSQSFDNGNKNDLVWQFAEELLYPYLKSCVRFVPAARKYL